MNFHDLVEQIDDLVVRPLEAAASHDGAEAAAQSRLTVLLEHFLDALGFAAREDDVAAAVEGPLDDALDAVGLRRQAAPQLFRGPP